MPISRQKANMNTKIGGQISRLFSVEGFRGPVLTLLSGAVLAMGIAFVLQPVLTRLYTPAEFGVANYFVAILTILMPLASFRYEDAVMIPDDDRDAAGVLRLSFILVLLTSSLCLLLIPWRETLAERAGVPGLAPWVLLIAPTLLFMRLGKISEVWLSRKKNFRIITSSQVAGSLTTVGTRITAGTALFNAGAGGLIGGFLVGYVVSFFIYGFNLLKSSSNLLFRAFRLKELASTAKRFRRFPLYSTPSALLSAFVARLPLLLLPQFFNEAVLGLFGLATNVLSVPLSLIGGAVAQVFFVHAAEANRSGGLANLTRTVHTRLVMIGIFPALALILAGPDVFGIVFGAPWREAGRYAGYLAPWLFLTSVASPLTRLFDVLERQRADLATSTLMFLLLATALLAGGMSGDLYRTLFYVGLAGAGVRLVQILVMLSLAGLRKRDMALPYVKYGLYGLITLAPVLVAYRYQQPWLMLILTSLGGMSYYGFVIWRDKLLHDR